MAENDFDIDGLARYLHITPQQVERLASRGQLPARRVGGKWRFSPGEIHHWMEERMGLLEDVELQQVEGALARADNMQTADICIADMLHPDTIDIALTGRTKNSIINQMCQLAANTGLLWDAEAMADAVRAREQLQSTAMDNGVALLHPRRPLANILAEPILAVGISPQGIPFGGSSRLTDLFLLICSCDDRGHLRTLARLSRLICDEQFLPSLRAAADAREVYELFCEAERALT
jgi:PTS system nitrogen regulatory IIA component